MDLGGFSYGDFLAEYNRQAPSPHEVEDTRAPKREEKAPAAHPKDKRAKPRSRHKGRAIFLGLLLTLALLSGGVLVADFFLPQGVVGWVEGVFAHSSDHLYAVAHRAADLDEARNISQGVRAQGGGGFVAFDGSYYVLLSVYPTQEEAQEVAGKGGYLVYPLLTDSYSSSDFPLSIRSKVKDILSYPTEVYQDLYKLSVEVQEGTTTVAQAKIVVYNILSALTTHTQSFRNAASSSGDTVVVNYNASLLAVMAALDNLTNSKSEGAIWLADLRWTYILTLRVNRL